MKSAHKLKNAKKVSHRKVGISKDLTQSQRENNKILRQELMRKKEECPEKKWVIRREKVIELKGHTGIPPGQSGGDKGE